MYTRNYLLILFSFIGLLCSCSSNDNDLGGDEQTLKELGLDIDLFKKLENTSWYLANAKVYYRDGTDDYISFRADEREIYTLTSNATTNRIDSYPAFEMLVDAPSSNIYYNDGNTTIEDWSAHDGILLSCFNLWGKIITLNKVEMIIQLDFPNNKYVAYERRTYKKVSEPTHKITHSTDTYLNRTSNYIQEGNSFFNSTGNGENSGNSGDSPSGGNSGNSGTTDHHYPCKSCDETGNCWNCFGKGIDPITNKKCNTCHGSGKCQTCHGKGYIIV